MSSTKQRNKKANFIQHTSTSSLLLDCLQRSSPKAVKAFNNAAKQAFSQDFESGSPNFMWAKGPHSMAPAAPCSWWGLGEHNFEKLKPLRRDFHNSDSCKRLSIYLLNRCFSLKALLSYPFLNLPCLTLNYIWDRNSSCYEEWLKFEVVKPWFTQKNRYAWLCWSNCILVHKCQSPNLRNATSFIIFSKEL